MGLTYGTNSRLGVPVTLKFLYGGTEVSWGQPYKINGLTNTGESVDGKYRISDLDVQLIDKDGSLFRNYFGGGTAGFGTSVQVVAYVGGTMEYQAQGLTTMWKSLGTAGAYVATVHTGKVYGISYANRLLRIRSKNSMALIGDLKWQFPIALSGLDCGPLGNGYQLGSFFFCDADLRNLYLGSTAFYNYSEGGQRWDSNGYILGSVFTGSPPNLRAKYPKLGGRGTADIDGNYYWAGTDSGGTNFYENYDFYKFEGTYFTRTTATINTEREAHEYGYVTLSEAEDAKASGTYVINRTRFRTTGTTTGSVLHFIAPMRLTGTPKQIFEYLTTGAMVTPYFTSSDLDSTTLNASGTITAYSTYDKTIDFDDKKVVDSIKDIVESTQALFSVNTSNKFEFLTYGPKNLREIIPDAGTDSIVSSEFENLEEDYFNRFIVKYKYDAIGNKFNDQTETKTSQWNKSGDRLKTLECKWIKNPNEAVILANRLAVRYEHTIPHINFTTNLNKLGLQIGTLLRITDPNSSLSGKVVQVVGYNKNWSERTIEFQALDAESLYQRKGFAFWGTTGTLPGDTVTNSSVSGWGTGGTVNNINGTLYGSYFAWW